MCVIGLRLLRFLTHTSSILKIFPYKNLMHWNVRDFLKIEMPPQNDEIILFLLYYAF